MKTAVLACALLIACGGKQQPQGGGMENTGSAEPAIKDARTPIDKRRDAACEQLQPKLTECAVDDAKKTMTPAEYKKLNPEELRGKHKQKFLEECKGSRMSSRQVRVLEVCYREEKDCDPLAECLKNLEPKKE